ncbi:transposase [Streptococcus pneumoniae]|nr:transposase [Streptococcus pneumoniae]
MSFIAQDFNNLNISLFLKVEHKLSSEITFLNMIEPSDVRVKIITMDMFSPYYDLAKQLRFQISRLRLKQSPNAKIVLDCFHIVQHLSRAMSRVRVQIMNQFHRKSHEYKAIKRYWKLIQQDSCKLSDKRFYRPIFRMHLTNKEILNKLLSYSEDLKHHYQLYQLLLFHFQNKEPEKFFGLIEDNLKQVHPIFQTVFKTFLKDKEKIINALQLHYSNAKLEATNNLIKLIKRNAFGFRNFENFKKRIFIALNIKKERTKFVLSRA